MKGKGKGERNKEKEKKEKEDDCPLNLPSLKPVDHTRQCPRYNSVLEREEEEGIGIEELDILQAELETLLASVAKRMRLLETEINILNNWQDVRGKDKKGATPGKVQPDAAPSPSGKRGGKGGDDKSTKRFKDSSGKATTPASTSSKPHKGKGQARSQELPPDSPKPAALPPPPPPPSASATTGPASTASTGVSHHPLQLENPNPRVIKHDAPNRFWSMVEPYCREVTSDDLKVLEDLMRTHEDEAEYYKIPSLGKHYSQKWAQEDMLEEQREGGKLNKKGLVNNNNNKNSNDANSLMKRLEERGEEQSPFGPLTQRLVQALIEENIMAPLDDTPISEAEAVEAATISPRNLAKQLNLGNAAALERRIKRELEEQGIFEVEDRPEDDPDDEILIELRKKQQELRALNQHNLTITKRLYKLSKEEIQRQELRKKMAVADAEVMEAFRKIQATRQKKKTPSKKEKEAAIRAMKEREQIVKHLESMSS